MFSSRAHPDPEPNRLTTAIAIRRQDGREVLDLTCSNPTTAGIEYPLDEIAEALARGGRAAYEPDPLGLRSAREAVAVALAARGESAPAEDIVLTASTSEAYAFLFKLLADPGDEILTARPAYPLLDHLAAIEHARLTHFPLELDRCWHLHRGEVERAITLRTRAIAVVHPNNPAGSYLTRDEMAALCDLCAARDLALISDEVFFDYPLDVPSDRAPSAAEMQHESLRFSLGGLSKSAGLPHLKLGWIRVAGAAGTKARALRALEMISDNFLSVSTPVQAALPDLLSIGERIRNAIRARTRANLAGLQRAAGEIASIELLRVEGGWSAVLRLPRLMSDDDFAVRLLESRGVLVHPGHFFDFEREGHIVLSLLSEPGIFTEGARRIMEEARSMAS